MKVSLTKKIATVCHEVNRIYCESLGDHSQPTWAEAPEWAKTSALNGVRFHLAHPDAPPSASHEQWMQEKLATGWKFGPVKDPAKKEHPYLVPYEQLPKEQQFKDLFFVTIVNALRPPTAI